MRNDSSAVDLTAILDDDDLIDGALQKAARQAIREHKEEGLPLAMWRDDQVVWMSAEEIEVEIEVAPSKSSGNVEP